MSAGTVVLWNSPVFVSVFGVSSTVRSLFCSEETGITQKRHPSQDNNRAHTRTPLTPADNAPVWTSTALSTCRTRAGLTADVYRLVLDSETLARCLSVSEKMCPTNHPSHFNFQTQILRRDSADTKEKSAQLFGLHCCQQSRNTSSAKSNRMMDLDEDITYLYYILGCITLICLNGLRSELITKNPRLFIFQ